MRTTLFAIFFAAASIAAFSFAPPAFAHDVDAPHLLYDPPGHDKPGPPLRETSALLTFVEHEDMDDSFLFFEGDAEVSLTIGVAHSRHGGSTRPIIEPDLDYDETEGFWLVFEEVYKHLECTPMDPMVITLSGFEADATKLDEIEKKLLDLASQLATLFLSSATGFDVDSSILTKLVAGFLAEINPDDSLGKGSVVVPAPGVYDIVTTGGKYSVTATFDVASPAVAGEACDPDSSWVVPPPQLCYFSGVYFDSLLSTCNLIDLIEVEEGNPGEVTPQDLEDAKSSLRSLVIEMAHWAAAHMVEDARGLSGFSSSIFYLDQGEQNPNESAIFDYRTAFCDAELAIVNDVPDPFAPAMPPRAVSTPRMIATREGRTVDYLLGVFGDGSEITLVQSVTGGPPGASFILEAADPEHPSWHVLHVEQDGPPGTYVIQVQFTNPQVAPLQLTLDIDEEHATGVADGGVRLAPEQFAMYPIRPNPVVQGGSFWVELPEAGEIDLSIYDVTGRLVRDLAMGQLRAAGRHVFAFNAHSYSSGVYYVRLNVRSQEGTTRYTETRKFVVTR